MVSNPPRGCGLETPLSLDKVPWLLLLGDELTAALVPCLRRATAVNYTDADEDAEKLMSFLDEVSCRIRYSFEDSADDPG